jgi:ferredoxin-NADP reductase
VVVVARTRAELPYAEELERYGAFVALTRENSDGRVAAPPYVEEVLPLAGGTERAYVCGSVGFASFATRLLEDAGIAVDTIRVEQFGETG